MLISESQTNDLCLCLCHTYAWNTSSFTDCCYAITSDMPRPLTSTISPHCISYAVLSYKENWCEK